MELDDLARRVERAAGTLTGTAERLGRLAPGARAFGGDTGGHLGALGRALSGQCDEALDARSAEARRAGSAAAELADAVRGAAVGYRDLETRLDGGAR